MAENYVVTKEDGRLKDYLHGYNNLEGVKQDGIFMTRITLGSFNWHVW